MEALLTADDVAQRVRVARRTVRTGLREGRLVGFQPGGTRIGWRVRASDRERFGAQALAERGA
jgi:hypothetical protein